MKFYFMWIICLFIFQRMKATHASCNDTNVTSQLFFLDSKSLSEYLEFNVTCHSNSIKIKLSRCAATAMGYGSDVALFNSSGKPHTDKKCLNNDDENYIKMRLRKKFFSLCAHKITKTSKGKVYEFLLKTTNNYTNVLISRHPQLRFHFSCTYNTSFKMTSRNKLILETDDRELKLNLKSENSLPDEIFNSSFTLFNDSSFKYPFSKNKIIPIRVPKLVYFEISVNAGDNYVTQGQDCWATPTSSSKDPKKYYLVKKGCETDDKLYPNANKVILNYNSTKFRVAFKSFSWIKGETSLYLHCRIKLCNINIFRTCYDSPCTNDRRFRRHVINRPLDYHTLSSERIDLHVSNTKTSTKD